LVGDEADNPWNSCKLMLTREGHGHTILAGANEPTQEDGQAALKDGISAVTRPAARRCRARHRLAYVGDVAYSYPLYGSVSNVDNAGADRIHVVGARPRHYRLINEQLDPQHEGERPMSSADRGLLAQEQVAVHDLRP